ncbi:response regulator transcription factor [Marispirochaeta sp.]|uniref:response regulator transcription factor n=1 Tax=Marispirochaeta sp. TaxID=2038653 RepID=UPI0037480999
MAEVFIVEDNENVRDALAAYLKLEGIEVREFGALGPVETELKRRTPDLLVLDVMLPDGDGFLFAKQVKSRKDIPILFLTARDQESDRITGLEIGADDYVVKPFSSREVVLRIKKILARTSSPSRQNSPDYVLQESRLNIDQERHRITLDGGFVSLTAAEWNILTHLAARQPQVFSRLQLLESCLGSMAEGSERTIDTHVKNLRRKLGNDDWIETIRGFGYRFNGEPA